MSLQQAVSAALTNSETLKSASRDVDKAKVTFEDANDALDFIPTAPNTSAVEVPYSQMLSAQLSYNSSKRSLTTAEEGIVISTTNKYWNILIDQEKVKVAELGVKNALQQLQNAEAGKRVGTLDNVSLLDMKSKYQTSLANLSSARYDLNNAYTTFNQVVGLGTEDRPILTDTVNYKPLEADNPDYQVAKVLSSSPEVWNKEQAISMKKILNNIDFYSGSVSSAEIGDIEVEQAELSAASMKKLTEQSTRALFYQIKSQEDTYNKTLENIKVLEENLRIAKIKFDLGMVTAADVATNEKALVDARTSLFELICSHEYNKLAFEKPWAV
jgi:outer membrane protein TolC